MKAVAGLALAFAAMVGKASAEAVVALTDSTFDDHIAKYKYALVELYAPWCGHCKSLAPEYEKAAEYFAENEVEGGLTLVKIDATEEKELASKFDVSGFPTLKFLVNGETMDYGGGRTKDEIVAWLNKKTGPPAKALEDADAFTAFKESASVVVVGYFADQESDAAKAFLGAAETDDDAAYGISSADAVKEAAGLSGDGVVVFRDFEAPDEPRVEFEGEITKDAVKTFVGGNLLPLVVPFSQQTAPKIFGGAIKQHCLVFLDNEGAEKDAVMGSAREVATEYKGEYLFVTVDKSDDRILEFFGLKEEDLPTARIVVMADDGMKKFALESAGIETDALKAFLASHKSGELKQSLKSEDDIPDEDQKDPVWTLVGHNHDRVVFEKYPEAVKLVAFVAPWCGHCKKLKPDYEKLGEHYKDDDKVIIAMMDATANEVDSVSVQGFPTLKLAKAGESEYIDFDGSRDFDGMKEFIEKHRT